MQDYKQIFTLCLLLVFSLFLTHTSYAQLNAEVIGDAEITGDLKIRFSDPTGADENMLVLERFQSGFSFGQITIPSSNNRWSLDIPFGIFNNGNNLNLNYNGDTKLTFVRSLGEINRPQNGAADLLPYAYGRIQTNGTATLAGTTVNYTVLRNNNFYTEIIFSEAIANLLVINVTPEIVTPGEFPPLSTQVGIEYINNQTIRIYIFDSNGNVQDDAGFSFIAYKP